jgi:general secretion pathway protein D
MAMRTKKIWSAVLVVFTVLMLGSLSSAAWISAPQQPTPAAPAVQKDSPKLMLNYEDIDLHMFINHIAFYLDLTPIIIDPDVKGKVTVRSSSPMPKEDVLPLFNTILKKNNAALIKQGDVYQIVPIAAPVK